MSKKPTTRRPRNLERYKSIAIGSDDTVFVSDSTLHRIHQIDPNGKVTAFAGTGVAGFSGDGSLAKNAQFNEPSGLVLAADGTLYLADTLNNRIRKILPSGEISTLMYGPGIAVNKIAIGPSGEIFYSSPTTFGKVVAGQPHFLMGPTADLAIFPDGRLLFVGGGLSTIYLLKSTGQSIGAYGSLPGFAGDGGLVSGASFNQPSGLFIDDAGIAYIADTGNGRIRRLTPDAASGSFKIDTLLGGSSAKDCSGFIKKNLNSQDIENEIQVSLSALCYSKPVAFALRNHCQENSPHITMALAQSFGETSNIVRIRRPCH
jgi:hypothetical protein